MSRTLGRGSFPTVSGVFRVVLRLSRVAPCPPVPPASLETASFAHRALALVVDWIASTLVTIAILGPETWSRSSVSGFVTLGVFVAQSTLLTASWPAASFGKLATRLRVVRWPAGGRVDPLRCLLRAALVALVVPPLVFTSDGQGLHDLAARTGVVPLRSLP